MKIESIRLKNFKAFKDAEMRDIPRFCVLIGANGSGKSTFFNVFGFLKDALNDNVHVALTKLGGSRGLLKARSRNTEGPIEIELKFRENDTSPLITYFLAIGEEGGTPVVEREILKYRRGSRGQPWHFLDFAHGDGDAVTNEPDEVKSEKDLQRERQTLKSRDTLTIKGLAQFKKFPAAMALGELIANWHVSDFQIQNARRGGQVFVSTHSPDFLNACELKEVFWLVKEQGYTSIRRASDDPQIVAYMKDGDQMGYLRKQGFFKGADPQ